MGWAARPSRYPVPVGDASKDAEPQRTPQKFVLQRWYHATIMPTPSIGDDIFLCDLGDNCRHYMYRYGCDDRAVQLYTYVYLKIISI